MAGNRDVLLNYMTYLAVVWLISTLTGVEACSGSTCSECITSGADCTWCADNNFTSAIEERCGLEESLRDRGCLYIQNPQTEEVLSMRTDKEVTDGSSENGTDAIQIQPQKMYIKLRPKGKGSDFKVTFRPANNFPVDLYFLFDLSSTMKVYIKDFAKLARDIADEIGKISKDFMMGYGTFQDKVLLPFTNVHPAKLKNPCTAKSPCAPPFDYRHELAMTRDINTFTTTVDWSTGNTTGNIDRPEGGFDAMLQAIVCKNVGWRNNSRQLIILASDARMHFAGDGKLGGLITPNDGQCHLDDGRTNSVSKIQDYPSVGQISEALDRSKKHVIFAVVKTMVREYRQLTSRIHRASVSTLKGGKDSNIVDIVRNKYLEMTKGVELEYTASSPNIRVTITPTCEHQDGSSCKNLVIGKKVDPFLVTIQADRCPEDPKDRIQNVTIAPSDFLKDKLTVIVEILCDCPCEKNASNSLEMVPSEQCSEGNGTLECGICRCFQGRLGGQCECDQQDDHSSTSLDGSCSKDGGGNGTQQGPECNGLGQCVCGQCQCVPGYSGTLCQCNNKVCPIFNGLVCAGNGDCPCEVCQCAENYTGLACECPTSTDGCKMDGDDEVCSGEGVCECGKCVCNEGYLGSVCQTCLLCGVVCEDEQYRQCAECSLNGKPCPDNCTEVVDKVMLDGQCMRQRTDVSFDVLPIVLWVVFGVLGVGVVLLLLFKLLTWLFDRLEYQHFLRESKTPKWAKYKNPIYKEATTTYYNPTMVRD